jgi:uncharacterized protein (DUF488 family)
MLPVDLDGAQRVFTIGHGTRAAGELVECLLGAGVETLVDVRRFPGSRRNPQFGQAALAATLDEAGIGAFRSYAARMGTSAWQDALAAELAEPVPCFMCAETLWTKCHRRLIAELLFARGYEVVHLLSPTRREPHRLYDESDVRDGRLYVCGQLVA